MAAKIILKYFHLNMQRKKKICKNQFHLKNTNRTEKEIDKK